MAQKEHARITVQVHPNASRSEVIGLRDNVLHVRVAAPPVEGKANVELVEFLSTMLGVAKSRITIERGAAARRKTVAVRGLERASVLRVLVH